MNEKSFYRAFEDRHRGSRELIKSRLEVYLPFLVLLKKATSRTCVGLDIGCGRGEWLELLTEHGFEMHGIDLDQGMLDACQQRSFNVSLGDGIEYLAEQESESLDVISAFHVVEHISFEQLQRLAGEAQRVLTPGGLLILETPNPENLAVATASFYLDPTHMKPIPPMLLSFVTEFAGFERNKVLRLQEAKDIRDKAFSSLTEVINSVSPDYAVVAQKTAPHDFLDLFIELFNQEYGVSLSELSTRFDNRFNITEAKASEAEAKASEAEARTHDALQHYHLVVNSNSWKMTKPLRLFGKAVRWFFRGSYHWLTFSPTSRPRRAVKNLILKCKDYINVRPRLKSKVLYLFNRFPVLKLKLKRLTNFSFEDNCKKTDNSAKIFKNEFINNGLFKDKNIKSINEGQRTPLEKFIVKGRK